MPAIVAVLENLTDIINEYTIDRRSHIYGWRGRHQVISEIVSRYKFSENARLVELFEKVIDYTVPTYEIEVRSLIELCNTENGILRIPDKKIQNRLLRKIVSTVPGERVPRHRLIRNLIDAGDFDQAQTEIRIFERDFKRKDGPVARYKIDVLVERAIRSEKIMLEDRIAILQEARELAVSSVSRYQYSRVVFGAYCNVGYQIANLTGQLEVFEDAMAKLKDAEKRLGDPEITSMIRRYERMIAAPRTASPSHPTGGIELE